MEKENRRIAKEERAKKKADELKGKTGNPPHGTACDFCLNRCIPAAPKGGQEENRNLGGMRHTHVHREFAITAF